MLIINKEGLQRLQEKLRNPEEVGQCREELKKMLEIKDTLLWRAHSGCACVGWELPAYLSWEVQLLDKTLSAIDQHEIDKAISLLDEYIKQCDRVQWG